MRVLLDTNVVISAILFGGAPRQLLETALSGGIDLVTSPPLLAELERVLIHKFQFRSTNAASIRAELDALGEVAEPARARRVTRSITDHFVLATAVGGKVDVVVTGDKELLALESYEGIPIESIRAFLERPNKGT